MYVNIHVLNNWPASAPNRNKNNQQKTIMYGQVLRSRVSSQAMKRPTRLAFNDTLELGATASRSRHYHRDAANILITEHGWPEDEAFASCMLIHKALAGGDGKSMIMLKSTADRECADLAITHRDALKAATPPADIDKESSKTEKDAHKEAVKSAAAAAKDLDYEQFNTLYDSTGNIDIAVNGRMIAKNANFGVNSAVRVTHSFSTGIYTPEEDFFTAVDDRSQIGIDAASSMLESKPIGSGLYYRNATVNMQQLADNLGSTLTDVIPHTLSWIDAFVMAQPVSFATSTATNTYPTMVMLHISDWAHGGNHSTAYIKPTNPYEGNGDENICAINRLTKEHADTTQRWGNHGPAFAMIPDTAEQPNETSGITIIDNYSGILENASNYLKDNT